MLETGKNSLKLVRDNSDSMQLALSAEEAMRALHSLQLALEDKILSEETQDGE
jgi:hypothetical protein